MILKLFVPLLVTVPIPEVVIVVCACAGKTTVLPPTTLKLLALIAKLGCGMFMSKLLVPALLIVPIPELVILVGKVAGKLTVLFVGPTVKTLFETESVGAMSTVFPPLILNVLGDNKLKLGVADIVKFGLDPVKLIFVPGE